MDIYYSTFILTRALILCVAYCEGCNFETFLEDPII